MNSFLPVAVVAALGLAFTTHGRADDGADRAASFKQLRQLAQLSSAFASGNGGRLPATFDELLAFHQISDRSVLVSPYAKQDEKPSYELLLPGKKLSGVTRPDRTVAIRSLYALPEGGRLGAFVDGHLEIIHPPAR
jgi:hypothetical protein